MKCVIVGRYFAPTMLSLPGNRVSCGRVITASTFLDQNVISISAVPDTVTKTVRRSVEFKATIMQGTTIIRTVPVAKTTVSCFCFFCSIILENQNEAFCRANFFCVCSAVRTHHNRGVFLIFFSANHRANNNSVQNFGLPKGTRRVRWQKKALHWSILSASHRNIKTKITFLLKFR